MLDLRLVAVCLVVAVIMVGLATVAMHENHYKDRRYRMLDGRLSTLEGIILEDRHT